MVGTKSVKGRLLLTKVNSDDFCGVVTFRTMCKMTHGLIL